MSDSDQVNMMIQAHIESGNLESKNISLICRDTLMLQCIKIKLILEGAIIRGAPTQPRGKKKIDHQCRDTHAAMHQNQIEGNYQGAPRQPR